ncbi:MAG: pilus assembly protein TadG-related protein, partial [Acidobacteriota bacterium]
MRRDDDVITGPAGDAGGRRPLAGPVADERGSALAFAALAFLGILGMLALAIDLGMLFETRGQAQRAADAAALAGASALVDLGNDPAVEDQAFERADDYVDENPVRGELASLEPGDVDVDLEEWRVTVTVHRTAERENPVSTLFGRIIGKETVDVTALATAEAAEAGGAKCLLPLAIPDR